MQRIEILIDNAGNARVEAVGYKGRKCLEATKAIEEALGVAGKRTAKAEQYEADVAVGTAAKASGKK